MSNISHLFLIYGYAVLFVWVLIEQLGLPAPTAPVLLAAGTLSATGQMSGWASLGLCVAACLIGDSVWYALGRRYGGKVVRLLCKISFEATTCVSKTENYFARRGATTLLFAKFIPGLGTVAPPIAGQSGLSYSGFLGYDALGSLLWAGAWLAAGRFFGDAIRRNHAALTWLAHFALVLIAVLLVVGVLYRIIQQRLFLRRVMEMRVGPEVVYELMEQARERGEALPFLIDLRGPVDRELDPRVLPGAVLLLPSEVRKQLDRIPLDRDIILYCNCPNEEAAAKAAMHLHKAGVHRAKPLRGGFDGWKNAGFPLEEAGALAEFAG